MDMTIGMQANLASVQQAVQMTMLRQAMGQTGEVVAQLMQGMPDVSFAPIALPGLGENIDVSV